MKALIVLSLLLLANPADLPAQDTDTTMQRLAPLLGRWEGTGWQYGANGERIAAQVTERAESRLGGAAVVVEGEGRANGRVVHSALGVIAFDHPSGGYRMRAFRADGHMIDAEVEVGDGTLRWGFDDPRAGRVRFTARIANDVWEEIGESSRDGGATWRQFMAMTLRRAQ